MCNYLSGFQLEGYIFSFGYVTLPPVYEYRLVFLFGRYVFTMGDPELIKGYDHGGVVNLFDCIKDSAMDRVGRYNGVIFRRTDL